jgi:hypothetical protein
MAPSNMFSYLRPGHAKRTASNLASPEPVPSPAAYPLPSPSQSTEYFASPRFPDNASYLSSSPISPYPPQLPPITRVASKLDKSQSAGRPAPATDGASSQAGHHRDMLPPPLPPSTQEQRSPNTENTPLPVRPATANEPTGLRISHKTEHGQYLETPSQSSTHLGPQTISPSYSNFSKSQTSLIGGISEKLSGSSKGTSTPTAAPTKSKSRLTLRNPMSLLMRRRSGQTLDPLADESLVTQRSPAKVPSMPDNYDPSIRGHIVHDFNAPRLNRNFSYNNAYGNDQIQPGEGRVSPPKIDREHTPVFHEHFDDDTSYEESRAAIRAEQLVNNDFLARNSVQFLPPGPSPPPPPPVPKDPLPIPPPPLPKDLMPVPPQPTTSPPPRRSFQGADGASTVLSPVFEAPDPMLVSAEVAPRQRKSTKSPPPARSRATSVNDPSFQSAGLPSHFTSRASRFSFQISGGSDSAQEAILEERHKQKEAEKVSKQARLSTNTAEDDYDQYDMDEYDMDGGYEEEIPMLGEEDEFEGLGYQSMDADVNTFNFSNLSIQPNLNHSMSSVVPMGQMQTPVDANGNPIGFAVTEHMSQQLQAPPSNGPPGDLDENAGEVSGVNTSGLQHAYTGSSYAPSNVPTHGRLDKISPGDIDLGDDMYFDDGLIGEQDENDATVFDESMFDDPDGPLYERKMKPISVQEAQNTLPLQQPGFLSSETGYEADDDALTRHLDSSKPSLAHKTSVAHQPAQPAVPDFNNMNAYHSALADAATRAEAAGRFARKASVDNSQPRPDAEMSSDLSDSRPSLIPDEGRFSMDTDNYPSYPQDDEVFGMTSGYVDDYDYSDYDSALEDDPMIAAANAEALAFDDDGFYGQEFGFYASAVGDSPNAWGGFFGPSGIGRTVSGRNAVREPNLTPITERSEYSTRNSFISLNHFRDGQQPLSSPGLAQLARMSPYEWPEEDNMSLDTLMKLRKGAFGGSAVSLPGSTANSPRNSSPMGMQFVARLSSAAGNRMVEHTDSERESDESANIEDGYEGNGEDDEGLTDAVNTAYEDEDVSEEDAASERPESPTLTTSGYNSLSSPDGRLDGDIPPLPTAVQLQALHSMQSPSHMVLPMSPDGHMLHSPANMSLPISPYGVPLASPYAAQQRPTAPPSIDTSLSSPSATVSTSTGPRRQSMGLVSPISNSSPITPGGSGWRAGHSRKGSAADSVTYVRDHDEAGEGRWILERRRTAESGELELVGREIVEGGRI